MFYIIVILAALFAMPANAQGVDPYIGTWKLNLEKSTFVGIPAPKSYVTAITADGPNLSTTADIVGGRASTIKLMFIFDGQPHPTTGSSDFDACAFVRVGNTINQTFFKNGKVVAAGQARMVSDKQYVYTSESILANGQPTSRTYLFDRQ